MPFSRPLAKRSVIAAGDLRTHVVDIVNARGVDPGHVALVVSTCRDSRCQHLIHEFCGDGYAPFMIGGLAGVPSGGELGFSAALGSFDDPFVVAISLVHATTGESPPCAALAQWQQGVDHDNLEYDLLAAMLSGDAGADPSSGQEDLARTLGTMTAARLRSWLDAAVADGRARDGVVVNAMLLHGDNADEMVILD